MSANPSAKIRQQLVARRRDDVDRHRPLAELLRVFLVDPALEIAHEVGTDAAFAALVDEVQRPAVGRVARGSCGARACRRSRQSMACSQRELARRAAGA